MYLFKSILCMSINFHKTYLYTSRNNLLSTEQSAQTLHCARGLLPVTYFGIRISWKRPRRQVQEVLIDKTHGKLTAWSSRLLFLGGRLTLVNSMLSTIPTYQMSIFKLPAWVIKEIDKLISDFLQSRSNIYHSKMLLVSQKNLCIPRHQGDWGIPNLVLGKWW